MSFELAALTVLPDVMRLGAVASILVAGVFSLLYRLNRQRAELEGRRLIEGQLGVDRFWGTVALLTLPSKVVQTLSEPLMEQTSSPSDIARLLEENGIAGELYIVERTLIEANAEALSGWLQQRVQWIYKVPLPLVAQWDQQTLAFVMVGRTPAPFRMRVKTLTRELNVCAGAAVTIRNERNSRQNQWSLFLSAAYIPGALGITLLCIYVLLQIYRPKPRVSTPSVAPADLALPAADLSPVDAGKAPTDGRPHDAGQPTDAGKGIRIADKPASGAKVADTGKAGATKKDAIKGDASKRKDDKKSSKGSEQESLTGKNSTKAAVPPGTAAAGGATAGAAGGATADPAEPKPLAPGAQPKLPNADSGIRPGEHKAGGP